MKLKTYEYNTINKNPGPLDRWDYPMHCCGASYSEKEPKSFHAGKGIRIIFGKHGEEKVSNRLGKQTAINHVNTKNGWFTIITRY